MTSRYTFQEYSSDWPERFEREAGRIRRLLAEEIVAVHHIGSTAVSGLAAKPIIDVLPVVRDIERVDRYIGALRAAEYHPWGAYGLPGRRYFTRDRNGIRKANVHIFQEGNPEITRHVAFRDYLRAHSPVRDTYAQVKQSHYARHPADVGAYNDAKDAWVKRVEQQALEWCAGRGESEW